MPGPPRPSRRRPYLPARLGRRSGGAAGRRPPVSGPAGWGPRTSPTSSCSATHSGWAPGAGRPGRRERPRTGGGRGPGKARRRRRGLTGGTGTGRGRAADVGRGRDGGEAGGGGTPRWTQRSRRGRGACGAGHRGAGVRRGPADLSGVGPGSPGSAPEQAGRVEGGGLGWAGGVGGRAEARGLGPGSAQSPPPALEVLGRPEKLRSPSTPAPSINWMQRGRGALPCLPLSQDRLWRTPHPVSLSSSVLGGCGLQSKLYVRSNASNHATSRRGLPGMAPLAVARMEEDGQGGPGNISTRRPSARCGSWFGQPETCHLV